jgi:hypothetical protein
MANGYGMAKGHDGSEVVMCYCGTVKKEGFYQCCQDQITMNQESRYFGGQMSKREMVEWDMKRDPKAREQRKMEIEAFERQVNKSHFEKGEKIEVVAAYRPNEEWKMEYMGEWVGLEEEKEVPANETPREELLQRDVGILFDEKNRLFNENRLLKKQNESVLGKTEKILDQNIKLFEANKRLFLENQKLKAGKNNADM